MADEAWEFAVTVPAGTTQAAPLVTPTTFPQRRVDEIRWLIPPGPSGLAGWRITMGGVQVIPANAGGWIVRDGHVAGTALSKLPTSGGWDVTGYNTGKYPHTIYVTFLVTILVPVPPLDLRVVIIPGRQGPVPGTLPNSPAQIASARLAPGELEQTARQLRAWAGVA